MAIYSLILSVEDVVGAMVDVVVEFPVPVATVDEASPVD